MSGLLVLPGSVEQVYFVCFMVVGYVHLGGNFTRPSFFPHGHYKVFWVVTSPDDLTVNINFGFFHEFAPKKDFGFEENLMVYNA